MNVARTTSLLALLFAISTLAACGPPPKPKELQQLEDMRNDGKTGEISTNSPEMLEQSDKFYKMASKEWQEGSIERAREFAWLGQLRYKTAEAESAKKGEDARAEKARTELATATHETEVLATEIEGLKKSIGTYEQMISGKATEAERAAAAEVDQILLSAEAEREKARGVKADEFAGGEFNMGENILKLAREHGEAGRKDEAKKNAEEAIAKFKEAHDKAKPEYDKVAASNAALASVAALFDEAKKSFPGNAFQDARGIVIVIPAAFDKKKTTLLEGKKRSLEAIVNMANSHPNATIMVEGYTQAKGNDSKNLTISEARANSARDYLVGRGVDPKRMTSTGYGEEKPRYDNKDRDDRAKNDRVEFVFVIR